MNKLTPILLFLCFIFYNPGFTQVNVDMHRGTAHISIPVFEVKGHDLSHGISLRYSGTGVSVSDASTLYGINPIKNSNRVFHHDLYGVGWNLMAGGSIRRVVNSIPDDYLGVGVDKRKGWLYNDNAQSIGNFVVNTDGNPSTCADEQANWNFINPRIGKAEVMIYEDMEPDLYTASIGNINIKFVFDNQGNIQLLNYDDAKIEYQKDANSRIKEFSITTSDGIKYLFADTEQTTKSAYREDIGYPIFSELTYIQYKNSVVYNSAWFLSSIQSPSSPNDIITFSYIDHSLTSTNPITLGIANTEGIYNSRLQFKISETIKTKIVSEINSSDYNRVVFDYTYIRSDLRDDGGNIVGSFQERKLNQLEVYDKTTGSESLIKKVKFGYRIISNKNKYDDRVYLDEVTDEVNLECQYQNSATSNVKFEYYGLPTNISVLPPKNTENDIWGFYNVHAGNLTFPKIYKYPNMEGAEKYRFTPIKNYNGSPAILNGYDGSINDAAVIMGSLSKVKYITGAALSLAYEPNEYWDATANEPIKGGGIRIKKTYYHDGIGYANDVVKEYEYKMEDGKSSGRLISRPQYAFPALFYKNPVDNTVTTYEQLMAGTYTDQQRWERLTLMSEGGFNPTNLFDQDAAVVYERVSEISQGAGRSIYLFSVPATYGTVTSDIWKASYTNTARDAATGACPSLGAVKEGYYSFPFPPNANFDFERGLLLKQSDYNQSGGLAKEITYSYLRQQKGIAGVKGLYVYRALGQNLEKIYLYSLYNLFTNIRNVVKEKTERIIDPTNASLAITTTTSYYYESPNHLRLTKVTATNSNGIVNTVKYKYPQDYTVATSAADLQTSMLNKLKEKHIYDTPVETINYITKPGKATTMSKASLTLFNNFGADRVLPYQQLAINAPVAGFAESKVEGNAFVKDSTYKVYSTFESFDARGNATAISDKTKALKSYLYGYNNVLPVAEINNASPAEVAFSDFETQNGYQFDQIGTWTGSPYVTGRTGNNALSLTTAQSLKKIVTKKAAQSYLFSCWINTANGGSINLMLNGVAAGSINYIAANGKWKYIEKVISVNTLSKGSSITIEVKASSTVAMDDVAFYPYHAMLNTFTYKAPYGKSSETTSAQTTYYEYDGWGRVKYLRDKDKGIMKKFIYIDRQSATMTISASIDYDKNSIFEKTPGQFIAYYPCVPNAVYKWTFGDGTASVIGPAKVNHTYVVAGNYTITLTISRPGLQDLIHSEVCRVHKRPLQVSIALTGKSSIDICDFGNATIGNSVFSVSQIQDGNGSYTYEWYKINSAVLDAPGLHPWAMISTQASCSVGPGYESFDVKCRVTDSDGRQGESAPIRVNCYRSTPNCPPVQYE